MNKKGFTLIELLAVILILGIIALIAIPTVNDMIVESRKGAFKIGIQNIITATEQKCQTEMMEGIQHTDIYTFYDNEVTPDIDVKGKLPMTGTMKVDNECNISFDNISDGTYTAIKEKKDDSIDTEAKTGRYQTYTNGTAVYYNPVTGQKCSLKDSISTNNTKTGCMKWYTFNDIDDSTTVNMILDHDAVVGVAWNSTGTNTVMKEAKTELDNLVSISNWKTTPRLIGADEIAKITGNTTFNASTATENDWFYFGTNTDFTEYDGEGWYEEWESTGSYFSNEINQLQNKYAWLFDNLYGCKSYGCNAEDNTKYLNVTGTQTNGEWGYWTSSPRIDSTRYAWRVIQSGNLTIYGYVANNSATGIRPVITISKSVIS